MVNLLMVYRYQEELMAFEHAITIQSQDQSGTIEELCNT